MMRKAKSPKRTPVVELRPGQGDPRNKPEHYWHIYADGVRAGRVFIMIVDQPSFGRHHSLQIFLNKTHQGKGIGSMALKMAVEASGQREIYAHMRKSNTASRRVAEKAGFQPVSLAAGRQLSLLWVRGASGRAEAGSSSDSAAEGCRQGS